MDSDSEFSDMASKFIDELYSDLVLSESGHNSSIQIPVADNFLDFANLLENNSSGLVDADSQSPVENTNYVRGNPMVNDGHCQDTQETRLQTDKSDPITFNSTQLDGSKLMDFGCIFEEENEPERGAEIQLTANDTNRENPNTIFERYLNIEEEIDEDLNVGIGKKILEISPEEKTDRIPSASQTVDIDNLSACFPEEEPMDLSLNTKTPRDEPLIIKKRAKSIWEAKADSSKNTFETYCQKELDRICSGSEKYNNNFPSACFTQQIPLDLSVNANKDIYLQGKPLSPQEPPNMDRYVFKRDSETKRYWCYHCNKTFQTRHYLINHLRKAGQNPYYCEHCHHSFRSCADLRIHVKMHLGGKIYSCHVCNKAFTVYSSIVRHVKKTNHVAHKEPESLLNKK